MAGVQTYDPNKYKAQQISGLTYRSPDKNYEEQVAPITQLISSGQYRDLGGKYQEARAAFDRGEGSLEDVMSAIKGSQQYDPNKGPQINYGQGAQAMSPAQLGALAQGKGLSEAANIGFTPTADVQAMNQAVAQQNTQTQDKWRKVYEQTKGVQAPQDFYKGAAMVGQAAQGMTQPEPPKAVSEFYKTDPTIQTATQEWMNFNNPTNLQSELLTQMKTIMGQKAELGSLKAEYMNVQNIMGGTEQDIRDEITRSGGVATDSQVQALSVARNRTLLKKAALLQNQMALQQDAIQNSTQLLSFEKEMAAMQFSQNMQMAQFQYQIQKDAKSAAIDSLNVITKNLGWSAVIGSDSNQNAKIESLLGLPKGSAQQLASIDEKKRSQEEYIKKLEIEGKRLDIQKKQSELRADEIKNQPVSLASQYSMVKDKADIINSLLVDPALENAVGPNALSRNVSFITGGMRDFIASVDQLTNQLTLDTLIKAKGSGATFGALSEGELRLLASAATKINSFASKDDGQTVGYVANEADFKNELQKIKNYARLDYVRKGGDPNLVGLTQLPNRAFSAKSWDGSYVVIQ